MRNILIGAVAGLILGSMGALAYSHFVGEAQLADLQAQLAAAIANAAKAVQDKKDLASESTSLAAQVDALQKSNEELKHPADADTRAPSGPPPPGGDMGALAGVMRNMFRNGGFQNPQQRMLLFKTRLHLTSEQATALQAAMDADEKARRDMMRQAFQNGGKVDPAAAAKANTTDATLAKVLNPDQQRAYAQLQTDEKTARADSMATTQIDSMMPLLQLTDSQKDQVYTALYQAQLAAPDPTTLMMNPNPMGALTSQAQATSTALSKVLNTDQMALYQQQNQAFGGQGRRGGINNATQGTNANNVTAPASPVVGATASTATTVSPSGVTYSAAGGSTFTVPSPAPVNVAPQVVANPGAPAATNDSTASNPPAATTNAAAANPPASTNAAPQ